MAARSSSSTKERQVTGSESAQKSASKDPIEDFPSLAPPPPPPPLPAAAVAAKQERDRLKQRQQERGMGGEFSFDAAFDDDDDDEHEDRDDGEEGDSGGEELMPISEGGGKGRGERAGFETGTSPEAAYGTAVLGSSPNTALINALNLHDEYFMYQVRRSISRPGCPALYEDLLAKIGVDTVPVLSPFQARDGRWIFLHPLNLRCLLHHYKTYEACPAVLEAPVLELEDVVGRIPHTFPTLFPHFPALLGSRQVEGTLLPFFSHPSLAPGAVRSHAPALPLTCAPARRLCVPAGRGLARRAAAARVARAVRGRASAARAAAAAARGRGAARGSEGGRRGKGCQRGQARALDPGAEGHAGAGRHSRTLGCAPVCVPRG